MSYKRIDLELGDLPTSNLTTKMLQTFDYVVPGAWRNITDFDQMIRVVTEEEDDDIIEAVRTRAFELYMDPEQHYHKAVRVFQLVDDVDKVVGAAALANSAAQTFSFLSFLDRITPKADTSQAVDAALKLVAELSAFCMINGIPGDSVTDFIKALGEYGREDLMRMCTYVAAEGLIPLGPDFARMMVDKVSEVDTSALTKNKLFQNIEGFLPGSGTRDKHGLILHTVEQARGWLEGFVAEHNLTRKEVEAKVRHFIDVGDKGLDIVAATIDVSTNYFEHTGIQTVSRSLIDRAYGEI